jgi:hypothetical protein
MKDFLNQEFAAGHVWRHRAPAGTHFDYAPGGSMLAGPGATSANPDWAALQKALAGKQPVSAPLVMGQYQGPPANPMAGSMIAGRGATSDNPDWAKLQQAFAGKQPMSAPLVMGQYQAPPPPAPSLRPPAPRIATFNGFGTARKTSNQLF